MLDRKAQFDSDMLCVAVRKMHCAFGPSESAVSLVEPEMQQSLSRDAGYGGWIKVCTEDGGGWMLRLGQHTVAHQHCNGGSFHELAKAAQDCRSRPGPVVELQDAARAAPAGAPETQMRLACVGGAGARDRSRPCRVRLQQAMLARWGRLWVSQGGQGLLLLMASWLGSDCLKP